MPKLDPDELVRMDVRVPRKLLKDLKSVAKENKRTLSSEVRLGMSIRVEHPTTKRDELRLKHGDEAALRKIGVEDACIDTPTRMSKVPLDKKKLALALTELENTLRWEYRVPQHKSRALACDVLWAYYEVAVENKK